MVGQVYCDLGPAVDLVETESVHQTTRTITKVLFVIFRGSFLIFAPTSEAVKKMELGHAPYLGLKVDRAPLMPTVKLRLLISRKTPRPLAPCAAHCFFRADTSR